MGLEAIFHVVIAVCSLAMVHHLETLDTYDESMIISDTILVLSKIKKIIYQTGNSPH